MAPKKQAAPRQQENVQLGPQAREGKSVHIAFWCDRQTLNMR